MPFGSFFKKVFKKHATEAAEKYVGGDAANALGGAIDSVDVGEADQIMQSFTGKLDP